MIEHPDYDVEMNLEEPVRRKISIQKWLIKSFLKSKFLELFAELCVLFLIVILWGRNAMA